MSGSARSLLRSHMRHVPSSSAGDAPSSRPSFTLEAWLCRPVSWRQGTDVTATCSSPLRVMADVRSAQ